MQLYWENEIKDLDEINIYRWSKYHFICIFEGGKVYSRKYVHRKNIVVSNAVGDVLRLEEVWERKEKL